MKNFLKFWLLFKRDNDRFVKTYRWLSNKWFWRIHYQFGIYICQNQMEKHSKLTKSPRRHQVELKVFWCLLKIQCLLYFNLSYRGSLLPFCEESEEKHPILTSCPSYSIMVWFGYWVGINKDDEHSQLVPAIKYQSLLSRIGTSVGGQALTKVKPCQGRSPSPWSYRYNSGQEQIPYPFGNMFCHWDLLLSSSWLNNRISTNS